MPYVEGKTIRGWGVMRPAPWKLAGVYPSRTEAEAKAREMGQGYEVHFGENQEGTDNFVRSSSD